MTAQPTGLPETPENSSTRFPGSGKRPSSAITCGSCGGWWTGLNSAHCSACHQTFTGVRGFDLHRRAGHCLNPAEIGLVAADKPWLGWSRPGTWAGPQSA